MPDFNDTDPKNKGLRDDKFKQINKQTDYFKNKSHEYVGTGVAKKGISVGQKFGNYQFAGKGEGGELRFHKNDSTIAEAKDYPPFDSTMKASNIIGKAGLYSPDNPKPTPEPSPTPEPGPTPRLLPIDSVFREKIPEVKLRQMPKLKGHLVCKAGGNCIEEGSMKMLPNGGVDKNRHSGVEFTPMDSTEWMAQAKPNAYKRTMFDKSNPNAKVTADDIKASEAYYRRAWNASEEINPEIERLMAAKDTTGVKNLLKKADSFPKDGKFYDIVDDPTDTRIAGPERYKFHTHNEMKKMRDTMGLDTKGFTGYKDFTEASSKVKAGQNKEEMNAFEAFKAKLERRLRKQP